MLKVYFNAINNNPSTALPYLLPFFLKCFFCWFWMKTFLNPLSKIYIKLIAPIKPVDTSPECKHEWKVVKRFNKVSNFMIWIHLPGVTRDVGSRNTLNSYIVRISNSIDSTFAKKDNVIIREW